jgi:hypothetical protein
MALLEYAYADRCFSQHKPGVNVGNDAVPEFNAKTIPAGTAPKDATFRPNPVDTVPPTLQSRDKSEIEADAEQAPANDFPGATSASVNTGLGKPMGGQTSSELRHDGQHHNKNPGSGLTGVASGAPAFKTVDAHNPDFADQRALDKDEATIGRGNVGGPAAEERVPETADRVAAENTLGRDKRV